MIRTFPFLAAVVIRALAEAVLPEPLPADGDRAPFLLALAFGAAVVLLEALTLFRTRGRRVAYHPGALLTLFGGVPHVVLALGLFSWRWDAFVRYRIAPPGEALSELCLLLPWIWGELLLQLARARILGRRAGEGGRLRGLATVAPMLFSLLAAHDLLSMHPLFRAAFDHLFWVRDLAFALGLLVLAAALPAWLVRACGARPLSDPDLLAACRLIAERAGIRLAGISVLPTGRRQLNAAVVGFLGRRRRILFTDLLLDLFRTRHVLAVFAHEAAHAAARHVPRQLLFFLVAPWLLAAAAAEFACGAEGVGPAGLSGEEFQLAVFTCVVLLLAPVFRRLSHAFELEADLRGASYLGSPRSMVEALTELGRYLPARALGPGFRHPSTQGRIEFLERAELAPGALISFRRRLRRLQALLLVVLGLGVAAAIPAYTRQADRARPDFLLSAGFPEEAYRLLLARSLDRPSRRDLAAPGGEDRFDGADDDLAEDLDAAQRARLLLWNGERGPAEVGALRRRARRRAARSLMHKDLYAARGWLGLMLRWGAADELTWELYRYLDAYLERKGRARLAELETRLKAVLRQIGGDPLLAEGAGRLLS